MSELKDKALPSEFSIKKFRELTVAFSELASLSYYDKDNEGSEGLRDMSEFINAYALIGIERGDATIEQLNSIFIKSLKDVIDNQ